MQVTNHDKLPEPLVRAIQNDAYSKGDADYSCSELIDSPRIVLLKQRHYDEITEDAADGIWRLLGKLGHKLAEQAGADNALLEERLFMEVAGRRISGASDVAQWVYEDGKITDYKFTSVWTAVFGDRIREWEAQQNIYAELFERHGFPVAALEICAIYRDWRPKEALQRGKDYPPRAQIIPLKLWPREKRVAYIVARVEAMKAAEPLPDDQLPHCTPEEMWERPTKYAVMKEGRKTALRVLDTLQSADGFLKQEEKRPKAGVLYVEKRPGSRPRCEDYCPAKGRCNQYAEYKAAQQAMEATSE